MARTTWRLAISVAPALLQPSLVLSAIPPCAVKDKGYEDPAVLTVNGGIQIVDAETCQMTCAGTPGCQVFTYYINSGGCWLQGISGKVPSPASIPGVLSGPAKCPSGTASTPDDDVDTDLGASPTIVSHASAIVDGPGKDIEGVSADGAKDMKGGGAVGVKAVDTEATRKVGGIPIWVSVLIALLVIVGAVIGFFVFCGNDTKKAAKTSKKRGVDVLPGSPKAAVKDTAGDESPLLSASAPAVPSMVAAPISSLSTTSSMNPVPTVTAVVPTYTSVPKPVVVTSPIVVTRAAPKVIATSPTVSMASMKTMGVVAPAEPAVHQPDLFERLDANHDGVLTREEFSKLAKD